MSRVSERTRYHVPKSQPGGRINLRSYRRVRFGTRMKPRAWPSTFWFQSALFNRGNTSRRAKFEALMLHCGARSQEPSA